MPIKGNHTATIKFLDNTNKNHFTEHSGKFARTMDKQLHMERGFPFNKLDKRRQKRLIKDADTILSKLNSTYFTKKIITTPRNNNSRVRGTKTSLSIGKSNKGSIKVRTKNMREIKRSTQKLYDKIYEEKMKSHF
jgi:hypothetical protein